MSVKSVTRGANDPEGTWGSAAKAFASRSLPFSTFAGVMAAAACALSDCNGIKAGVLRPGVMLQKRWKHSAKGRALGEATSGTIGRLSEEALGAAGGGNGNEALFGKRLFSRFLNMSSDSLLFPDSLSDESASDGSASSDESFKFDKS